MKKIVIYLLILFLTASATRAQKVRGAGATFRIGYGYSPGLSRAIRNMSPAPSGVYQNRFFLIGWEGYARLEKAILMLEGTAGSCRAESGEDFAEPLLLSGHYKVGWIIRETNKGWIYPSFGTGPGFITVGTFNNHDGQRTERKNFNLLSPSLDFAINADFMFPRLSDEWKNYDRFILGIRAGYCWSVTANHWRDDDWNRVPGLARYRNNSFYITAIMGQGGFIRVFK